MNISTKGFTLIELLISISILAIISIMILPDYNSFNKKNSLVQTALTLNNDIELVKNKALSGVYTTGCLDSNLDDCKADWGVEFDCANSKYTLRPYKVGDSSNYPDYYSYNSDVKTYTLPQNISFSGTCPDKWVFSRLSGLVVSSPTNNTAVLTYTGLTTTVKITLNTTTANLTLETN